MKRGWSAFWVGLMIAVAVVTYAMKDSAGRAADHVMQLRADIAHEKEQLNVLRAEWGVLDQPSRLQALVERYNSYLELKPLDVRQLATISDVPPKPPAADLVAVDGVRTGSIPGSAKPANAKPATSKQATDKPVMEKPRADRPVVPKQRAATPVAKAPAPAKPAELETGFLQ